jgi:hypothetical protein
MRNLVFSCIDLALPVIDERLVRGWLHPLVPDFLFMFLYDHLTPRDATKVLISPHPAS